MKPCGARARADFRVDKCGFAPLIHVCNSLKSLRKYLYLGMLDIDKGNNQNLRYAADRPHARKALAHAGIRLDCEALGYRSGNISVTPWHST